MFLQSKSEARIHAVNFHNAENQIHQPGKRKIKQIDGDAIKSKKFVCLYCAERYVFSVKVSSLIHHKSFTSFSET